MMTAQLVAGSNPDGLAFFGSVEAMALAFWHVHQTIAAFWGWH